MELTLARTAHALDRHGSGLTIEHTFPYQGAVGAVFPAAVSTGTGLRKVSDEQSAAGRGRSGGFNSRLRWSELARIAAGRPARPVQVRGDGGDSPAWSRKRDGYRPPKKLVRRASSLVSPSRVPYAELHAHSYFSFLDGVASPEELVEEAVRLDLDAMVLTDHDGMYGAVLGEFCTGVTIITTMSSDRPVGFACQSFSALSLDPPLVVFCPSTRSRAWQAIAAAGRFCVNVLGHDQQHISLTFGRPGTDKFRDVAWSLSPARMPIVDGSLAWIDCRVETVHEAGDHYLVVGCVESLHSSGTGRPLLFHRGAYTATERLRAVNTSPPLALPLAAGDWF